MIWVIRWENGVMECAAGCDPKDYDAVLMYAERKSATNGMSFVIV